MKMKFILLTLALAILLGGCKAKQEEVVQSKETLVKVVVTKVQERMHKPTLQYSGTIVANREANLGASLPGKVEKIFFAEGDFVKEGSLIVELSDEMLTQALIENQTLKKDLERISRLREKGSISEMDYDHIKAQFEASEAKTEMVRKNTRIFAPFSGVLVEKMMEEGEIYFINPGLDPGYSMRSGVVRLMQLNPIRVKFDVNEKDLSQVVAGLMVNVKPDAFPKAEFTGEVKSVKPMLSTLTRSASVEVVLQNPNTLLKPGMYAQVSVELPKQKMQFIPLKCIYRLPGTASDFVFVVRNSTVYRVAVERISTESSMVGVKGLTVGEEIIAEGKTRVTEGQKVDIVR